MAREFLTWLNVAAGKRWLDVGCGTGALSELILESTSPREVVGIDQSDAYVEYARQHVASDRATFEVGNAQSLPVQAGSVDVVVSGLVLNFVPVPETALREMVRVVRPGGLVAVYVWDYGGQMQMMRYFWDSAIALDPDALELDEGKRFPICTPEALRKIFASAGLREIEVRAIDAPTRFRDFDDYWSPFLGGQAPAPSYAMSLAEERRSELRERIRAALPINPDGSIDLIARAWAIRGASETGI